MDNLYKVAKLCLREHRWRPPDRYERIIYIFADRVTQEGGMLNFYQDGALVASFHAQWWTAAAKVDPVDELEKFLDELKNASDGYYPTL